MFERNLWKHERPSRVNVSSSFGYKSNRNAEILGRESELPIVAVKQGNACGAKGQYFKQSFQRKEYTVIDMLKDSLQSSQKRHKIDAEKVQDFQRKLYQKS